MRTNIFYSTFLFFALFFAQFQWSIAEEGVKDSKGKEFWMTFPPNFHNSPNLACSRDSLYIFIVAWEPTNVVISARDKNSVVATRNIVINDITKVHTERFSWCDYEIIGFNNSGSPSNPDRSDERAVPQHFNITSDNEISVYALNHAQTSTDACLVYPHDVLGKDYVVVAYNNSTSSGSATPSQFVVLATEDETTVEIDPAMTTSRNTNSRFSVKLQRGQSYLVQASPSLGINGDLTGTTVTSDKPVALFSGQQRALVPVQNSSLVSRDCLLAQMPPIESWGKNAFIVPYPTPTSASNVGDDLYRVVAAYDSTKVFVNNIEVSVLSAGGFYQSSLTFPAKITSDKPTLVAHIKKSSQTEFGSANGDPFMMVIPPSEQFLDSYRFISAQKYNQQNGEPEYIEQYVTIIVPDIAKNSTTVDGFAINLADFKPIPNSGYSYLWKRLTDGTHSVKADAPIGIYVYGYGNAVSYGYVGGMSVRPIDYNPPNVQASKRCFSVTGTIYDTLPGDSKLKSVAVQIGSEINVKTDVEQFTPYKDSVSFIANLLYPYSDGEFILVATDSVDQTTTKKITVDGFTVGIENIWEKDSLLDFERKITIGRKVCFPFFLTNYGKSPQTVTESIFTANSGFTHNSNFPITLLPGEKKEIFICFEAKDEGFFFDTLSITGICTQRKISSMKIQAFVDRNNPDISSIADPCNSVFTFSVSDSTDTDLGIKSIELIDSATVNCTMEQVVQKGKQYSFQIAVVNPELDAEFTIVVTDSAGNISQSRRIIPGFTLAFSTIVPGQNGAELLFGEQRIGSLVCDSLMIKNYGKYDIYLDEVWLDRNIRFSVPPSQIPLFVAAGQSAGLQVCYEPRRGVDNFSDSDSLNISFRCINRNFPMSGIGILNQSDTTSPRCAIPLIGNYVGNAKPLFSIAPMPADNNITLYIDGILENKSELNIRYAHGVTALSMDIPESNNVQREISIESKHLPAGSYIATIQSGAVIYSTTILIVH